MRGTGANPRRRPLRIGFSTGTAAAAAAQGALLALLGRPAAEVAVELPGGGSLTIPLQESRKAGEVGESRVIKDAGDDPDVTHGAQIGARVWVRADAAGEEIELRGGPGVGQVTKPGLPVPVGRPAINPVPRRMIVEGLRRVWETLRPGEPLRLTAEIRVERGEALARKTLNPRLGIVGGISILGTTGLVKPFSHAAYRATIASALRVARAQGVRDLVLTTGGKSELYARRLLPSLPEEAFVQMGDYVAFAVRLASRMGFAGVTLAAFFGKALKMAQGMGHTHAHKGPVDLERLAGWTAAETQDAALAHAVRQANTARGALEALSGAKAARVVARVGEEMLRAVRGYAETPMRLEGMIFDFAGQVVWRSE